MTPTKEMLLEVEFNLTRREKLRTKEREDLFKSWERNRKYELLFWFFFSSLFKNHRERSPETMKVGKQFCPISHRMSNNPI